MSSSSQVAVEHADEAGGRGVGLLGAGLTGQPEGDQVGDEQSGVGEVEDRARLGGVLVERVEREELQPVALEELGVRHPFVHRRDAALGARVAVVERVAEQPAVAQQAVVDGPGVHADAARSPGSARNASRRPFVAPRVQRRGCPSAGRPGSAPGRSGSA